MRYSETHGKSYYIGKLRIVLLTYTGVGSYFTSQRNNVFDALNRFLKALIDFSEIILKLLGMTMEGNNTKIYAIVNRLSCKVHIAKHTTVCLNGNVGISKFLNHSDNIGKLFKQSRLTAMKIDKLESSVLILPQKLIYQLSVYLFRCSHMRTHNTENA